MSKKKNDGWYLVTTLAILPIKDYKELKEVSPLTLATLQLSASKRQTNVKNQENAVRLLKKIIKILDKYGPCETL